MIPALLGALLISHGISKSYADWTIDDTSAEVTINFQAHDLKQARLVESQLLETVLVGTRLSGAPREGAPMVPCEPSPGAVRSVGDPVEEVQVSLRFACPTALALVEVREVYLPGLSPPHITIATFATHEGAFQHVFGPETQTLTRRSAPDAPAARPWAAALLAAAGAAAVIVWVRRRLASGRGGRSGPRADTPR